MLEIKDLLKEESPGTVGETLEFMLYECSLDEAPDISEVAVWQQILAERGGKFARYAELCRQWIDEENRAAQ